MGHASGTAMKNRQSVQQTPDTIVLETLMTRTALLRRVHRKHSVGQVRSLQYRNITLVVNLIKERLPFSVDHVPAQKDSMLASILRLQLTVNVPM
ncbi:hypothetical protein DPMN_066536 [Dreissena polymorpha]|uniref:Uncharacterized protein n=1 Tax=Dreissena polymorpha TaxID=45954 RepID=A0A9D3YWH6_DREPO|nr:hypothetical protein DPMN_066536 [Dreissena polymorpha]